MKQELDLFHDCGYIYLSTVEPAIGEAITVRLRVEKDQIEEAWIEISHDGAEWKAFSMQYEEDDRTGYYCFYKGKLSGQEEMFKYRFRVAEKGTHRRFYYTRTYVGEKDPYYEFGTTTPDDYWTLIPGFHTPDWAKSIIWYSVMPDAFYNGDITNDETISGENVSNSWNLPQHNLKYKYGGDLKGIEKKLDYIQELGCDAIFINPIFKSAQNAGYGPEYYKQIEHSLGNRQALADLAAAIHERGMHFMLDVVLTFVANHDIWFNKDMHNPFPGASQDWNSQYHDYFIFTGEEGDTTSYESDWGGIRLNYGSQKLRDFMYRDKESYLKTYCGEPFCVDGLRFDCGGALSGIKEDGSKLKDWEIMGEIRERMHEVNPDMLLLSEYSFNRSVEKGVWDSRWNLEFVIWGQKYMLEEVSESVIFERFNAEIYSAPRTFAFCQYNSLNDHDRSRKPGIKPYAFRAYQLIQMTQIGSPSIYYGDEIRNQRERGAFYSMEWNEAKWDYSVLYETKALIELRKTYSALRDGIIQYLRVDDDEHLFAYARINGEGIVITIASRNPESKSCQVSVRKLGEPDGTIFTDWFTGKQYVAQDGSVEVLLPPGGTILVKGRTFHSPQGKFEYTDAFNTLEVETSVSEKSDGEELLICNSCDADSVCLGVAVEDGELSVLARTKPGEERRVLGHARVNQTSRIRLTRDRENLCSVAVEREPGAWEVLVHDLHMELQNHVKVGIKTQNTDFGIFHKAQIHYEKEPVLWEDFRTGQGAMFDFAPSRQIQFREQGLCMSAPKEEQMLLSNAPGEDWTFQTLVLYPEASEGAYCGIICRQDAEIFVVAGRTLLAGKRCFFLGRAVNGKLKLYYTALDRFPEREAVLQFQRIGTTYSACFSYDKEVWEAIGEELVCGLCRERVGVLVKGACTATFAYACYGNAICDKQSLRTPHAPHFTGMNVEVMEQVIRQPKYRVLSGVWDYGEEGYVQSDKGLARLGICNKSYSDFKIDGTYRIEEGCGMIGFEFGKEKYDSPFGDGYLLALNEKRELSLTRGEEKLFSVIVPESFGKDIRLCVENRKGVLAVFAGLGAEPIAFLPNFERTKGFICYVMEGVRGRICNYLTASYDATFYPGSGYENLKYTSETIEKNWLHTHGFVNPLGVGVTHFEAGVLLHIKEFGEGTENPYAGFYLCSPEGRFDRNRALAVVVDWNHRLLIKSGEEVLESVTLQEERHIYLKVVMNWGILSVYAYPESGRDQKQKPVITYCGDWKNGGVISLCANRTGVVFEEFYLKDLDCK